MIKKYRSRFFLRIRIRSRVRGTAAVSGAMMLIIVAAQATIGQSTDVPAGRMQTQPSSLNTADSASVYTTTPAQPLSHARKPPPSLQKMMEHARDTLSRTEFMKHPYWGFGIGLQLGSQPFFSEWGKTLPTTSGELIGNSPALGAFVVNQSVPAYNFIVPFMVSYTPFITDSRSLSFEGNFYYLSKTFQATLSDRADSATQWLNWAQSCEAYSFSLGLSCRYTIPERYFKIEKSDRTFLILGLSVNPLMHCETSVAISAHQAADSLVAAARAYSRGHTFNGSGCSWQVGLGTMRSLSKNSGLEIDLSYRGSWYGNFRRNTTGALWTDVNPADNSPDKSLSFLTHAIEATFVFITGTAPAAAIKK